MGLFRKQRYCEAEATDARGRLLVCGAMAATHDAEVPPVTGEQRDEHIDYERRLLWCINSGTGVAEVTGLVTHR